MPPPYFKAFEVGSVGLLSEKLKHYPVLCNKKMKGYCKKKCSEQCVKFGGNALIIFEKIHRRSSIGF